MHAWSLGAAALSFFVLAAACSQSAPPSASATAAAAPPQSSPPAEGGDEGHEHAAPHGGTLIELGEEFAHVELLLDGASGTLTAYALDGEAERPVRLTQPTLDLSLALAGGTVARVTLVGVANALTGETVSDTSQFQASVPALKGATRFDGAVVAVTVRGQQFRDVPFSYPSTAHD